MQIFYIDEFGDHSMLTEPGVVPPELKRGVSEWFVLAGVGIRDTSRKPLAEALFEVKERHFGAGIMLQPWGDSELKGRYLFRATRSAASGHVLRHPAAYGVFDTPARVDALVRDIGLIFATYRPLVFAVGVDKKALLTRTKQVPPLGAAYAYLQQRIALTVERFYAGEGAALVADQQTQHETFFRSGKLNAIRDSMTHPLPIQPNFNLVLDKPVWIDTDLSSWDREVLQLADIVAYTVAECLKRGGPPAETCYLWERIRPALAIQWSTGQLESGGFAIYPKPAKYPNIEKPAQATGSTGFQKTTPAPA